MNIRIKRLYERPGKNDGARILIDRLWPRGIKKDEALIDEWIKDIAPSSKLRKWFGHDPAKWNEFKKKYSAELKKKENLCREIISKERNGIITLLYAAKDDEHNNAVALKEFIEKNKLK